MKKIIVLLFLLSSFGANAKSLFKVKSSQKTNNNTTAICWFWHKVTNAAGEVVGRERSCWSSKEGSYTDGQYWGSM